MNITQTTLSDVLIIEPAVFRDDRGYFFESFNADKMKQQGLNFDFMQDNEAKSTQGVLRGLHYQVPPFAQTKLVRVIAGEVLDVAVDIRQSSPFFGRHAAVLLSEENKKQMLIPKGFAHGYVVLSESAVFAYKVDNPYSRQHERGIIYHDTQLKIDWRMDQSLIQLSEKDKVLPGFKEAEYFE